MKTEDMTVGDVLRSAAKRVRQGWCQHASIDKRGNVCALGAMSRSTATGYYAAADTFCAALDIQSVALWNDTPGRTKEEVALALERAADYWDAQQTPAIVWTMREDVPA